MRTEIEGAAESALTDTRVGECYLRFPPRQSLLPR